MLSGAARTVIRVALSRRSRFALLAVVSLVVCSGCDDDLDGYYPLEAGHAWQYRVLVMQEGGALRGTAVVANLPPATVFGRVSVPQRSELFGKTVVRFLAATNVGVVEFAQQAGTAPPVADDPPDYVLRLPVAAGTSWSSIWKSTRDGGWVSFPTVKTITGTRETVMVPAGTFAECLRVKIAGKAEAALLTGSVTIEVTGEEWYAPDVGFIKGAFRETVNQGEATSELAINLESFREAR